MEREIARKRKDRSARAGLGEHMVSGTPKELEAFAAALPPTCTTYKYIALQRSITMRVSVLEKQS